MSYCTRQNLIDRFGEPELIQLTDRDNLGVIDDTVLNQAISDADAEINGYLTAYTLPLANVPANLVRIAGDIARYYLYADQCVEQVETRYNNAIKYLQLIGKGQISLGPDVSGTVTAAVNNAIEFESSVPVFGRDE